MGIIHYAYSFDRQLTGLDLAECFDLQKKLTISVYDTQIDRTVCNGFGMQFLEDLCFDREDWKSETTGYRDRMEKLIKVCVAKHISGVHKVSQSSFALIEALLPTFNWNVDKIKLLLMGRQFYHLVESFGLPDPDSPQGHLVKSPSWLPFDEVRNLSTDFKSEMKQFMHPTASSLKIAKAVKAHMFLDEQSDTDLMQRAFTEMTSRLQLGEQTGHDLLLINEAATYQNRVLDPI